MERSMLGCEQISFECTYGATSVPGETPEISTMTLERMTSQPGSTIKAAALRDFSLFADFSDRELRQLLRLMRRWDLPRGTVVVSEGGPGGSCFIIISGSVDVTVPYTRMLRLFSSPAEDLRDVKELRELPPLYRRSIVFQAAALGRFFGL